MNKFTVAELPTQEIKDATLPVLFKIHIGTKYYLHKGKVLSESVDRLLDDVWRGIRDKNCPDAYSNIVAYCKKFPAVHHVTVEVLMWAIPAKIMAMEDKLYKTMQKDENSLNRADIAPYKPEWMIKQAMQDRCDKCITDGVIASKKMKFKFCPKCGRLNK